MLIFKALLEAHSSLLSRNLDETGLSIKQPPAVLSRSFCAMQLLLHHVPLRLTIPGSLPPPPPPPTQTQSHTEPSKHSSAVANWLRSVVNFKICFSWKIKRPGISGPESLHGINWLKLSQGYPFRWACALQFTALSSSHFIYISYLASTDFWVSIP